MILLKKVKWSLLLSLLFLPLSVLAQSPAGGNPRAIIPTKPGALPGQNTDQFSSVVGGYINIFLGIVGLVAVAFLIYGGFRYITSAGNDEAAEAGKKIIQNSIIGLVIIILSYIIVTVVVRALFGQT